jgi:hypothetical protein
MIRRTGEARFSTWSKGLVALALMMSAWSAPALAQAPADAAAAPPPPPAPAAPPVPTPPPPAAVPPPAEPAKPPTAAEAMPASRPDVLPPIDVGAWSRVGGVFQSATDPKKLNDWHMDNAYVELHAGGKIHKKVGVTVNLNSNMATFPNNSFTSGSFVAIEDAIISFDFDDAFHLWAGHLLVPVDRANASGPFFMIPWNYPGFLGVGSVLNVGAPAEGPSGRNNGAVVWGDVAGGKFTWLAGVFDDANTGHHPLFSGRLRLDLLDPEGGFWGNASFFGDKDVFSVGVGGQFQKSTAAGGTDYSDINVDVLFEKKIPGGSWVTGEGAYYHFGVPTGGVSDSAYVLAAFASSAVGGGNVQPMVRFQWLKIKDVDTKPINLDVGLSYLIKGPALRLLATYGYTKVYDSMAMASATGNSIQLGAQAIFF